MSVSVGDQQLRSLVIQFMAVNFNDMMNHSDKIKALTGSEGKLTKSSSRPVELFHVIWQTMEKSTDLFSAY